MNSLLIINGVPISLFEERLYCLNDLHKAAGGQKKHQPSNFTSLKGTIEMLNVLPGCRWEKIHSVCGGHKQGTFVCKELVYAYAMWVSPTFFVRVLSELPLVASLRDRPSDEANAHLSPVKEQEKKEIEINKPDEKPSNFPTILGKSRIW